MDITILVSAFILVASALLLILYPLWQQTRPEATLQIDQAGQTLAEYQARYQALLTAMKDLMFDHEMGKVSTPDYEQLLAKTKLEAAQVRHQIDLLSSQATDLPLDPSLDSAIETLILQTQQDGLPKNEALLKEVDTEIELLKNKAGQDSLTCTNCGKTLTPDDAFCSRCGQAVTRPQPKLAPDTCPQCNYQIQPDDLFCAKCGATLKSETA